MSIVATPIGHPDAIPAVCAAHISILRLFISQSGLCVTSAAFVHQAANVGQFVPCGIHSACPVLSGGGVMLAVHGRKTVDALSRAIWERKARTMPTKKVGNVPGLFAYSGASMPGSFFAKKKCWHSGQAHDSGLYWCVAIFYFLKPKRH